MGLLQKSTDCLVTGVGSAKYWEACHRNSDLQAKAVCFRVCLQIMCMAIFKTLHYQAMLYTFLKSSRVFSRCSALLEDSQLYRILQEKNHELRQDGRQEMESLQATAFSATTSLAVWLTNPSHLQRSALQRDRRSSWAPTACDQIWVAQRCLGRLLYRQVQPRMCAEHALALF